MEEKNNSNGLQYLNTKKNRIIYRKCTGLVRNLLR